jgi:predicted esterase
MAAVAAPRVVVLHGYGQTAKGFMTRIGSVRNDSKFVSWFAVDAPFDCVTQAPQPKPKPEVAAAAAAASGDYASKRPPSPPVQLTLEEGARAWYSFAQVGETGRYDLFEDGIKRLSESIAGEAPPEFLFAFSQGTIVASVIARRIAEARAGRGQNPVRGFEQLRGIILCSGLVASDQQLRAEIMGGGSNKIGIPSLHIIGKTDKLVKPEKSFELSECFLSSEREIFEFDGGHVVPSAARKPLKEFLQRVLSAKAAE